MKDKIIKVADNSMVYFDDKVLGIDGENLQGKIIFYFENFKNGVAWLEFEKEDGTKKYIPMDKVNETYEVEIKPSLLSDTSIIYLQLRITEDENENGIPVFKSNKFYMNILSSINATSTIEEDYPDILDVLNNKLEINDIVAGDNIKIEKEDKKITISSTGGGGAGEVAKKYVDDQDTKTLENAKEYADNQVPNAVETYVKVHKEELKGEKGIDGKNGKDGTNGKDGINGTNGKNYSVEIVESTLTTQEIESNKFYKFGEVAELNITLADVKDNKQLNEFMFEFTSGATATTLTLPDIIKWLETPSIEENKIYQCSIVNNIGVLVGVANV